jgi:hypothetical protein
MLMAHSEISMVEGYYTGIVRVMFIEIFGKIRVDRLPRFATPCLKNAPSRERLFFVILRRPKDLAFASLRPDVSLRST